MMISISILKHPIEAGGIVFLRRESLESIQDVRWSSGPVDQFVGIFLRR